MRYSMLAALAALTVGLAAFYGSSSKGRPELMTTAATRGDIVQTVDATGTLASTTLRIWTSRCQ